jgi:hypothetical protein
MWMDFLISAIMMAISVTGMVTLVLYYAKVIHLSRSILWMIFLVTVVTVVTGILVT